MVRKQKWSNRKIAVQIILPLLVLSALALIALHMFTAANRPVGITSSARPQPAGESSAETELSETGKSGTTVVSVGKPITLSVEQDEKTKGAFGYAAGFPWQSGSMCLTVDSAELYASVIDAGITPEDCAYAIDADTPFALLEITLKNIDAQLYDEMNFSIGNLISANAFEGSNVQNDGYFTLEPVYFSEHPVSSEDARDYFHGELNPGSEKTFQLGFLIYDISDDLALQLGSSGSNHKYGVRLALRLNKENEP